MKIGLDQTECLEALKEFVRPWRKLTIAVDGITGAGKSTFSRYLAWQLGMPLVETDMFRIMEQEPPAYRYREIWMVLESRHELERPVIIEGVFTLQVLSQVNVKPDYLVYVENSEASEGLRYGKPLKRYFVGYSPRDKADYVLSTDFIF